MRLEWGSAVFLDQSGTSRPRLRQWLVEAVVLLVAALLIEIPWLVIGSRTSLSAEEAAWAAAAPHGGRPAVDGIYVLGLGIWADLLGLSESMLRSLSLVWTFVTTVGVWAVARRLLHPMAAALAPLLFAASPLVAAEAAEVSPYAQGAALMTLATWAYLGASRLRGWVFYGGLVAASLATLPASAAILVSHLGHAMWNAPADRSRFLRVLMVLCGGCLPLAIAALLRALGIPPPGTVLPTAIEPVPPPWSGPPLIMLAVGLVGLLATPRQRRVPQGLLLGMPWALLIGTGAVLGWIDPRLLLVAIPLGAVALAGALDLLGRGLAIGAREVSGSKAPSGVLRAVAALAGLTLIAATGGAAFLRAEADRSDYRGLVFQVLREARGGDLLVLAAPGLREAVEYYNRGRAPLMELPFAPFLLESSAEAMLASVTSVPRQLWVVTPGVNAVGSAADVKRWLAGLFYPTSAFAYGNSELVVYSTEPDMRTGQGRTTFGNSIEVPEVALPAGAVPRDFPIAVRLTWRPREAVAARLTVLVELVDGSRVLARHESQPAGGTRPTTAWEPGETVIDRVALTVPDAVTTGSYTVRVALYDVGTRARWRLADGRESLDIGMVRIGPATRPPL